MNFDEILRRKSLLFELLKQLEDSFGKKISNSFLNNLRNVEDLKKYFEADEIPENSDNPLKKISRCEAGISENVHIIDNIHFFDPETDRMFDGKSAFPQQEIYRKSLKMRKKQQPNSLSYKEQFEFEENF